MSDTSGPAFPMTGMTVHGGQPIQSVYQNGMTLRDYFAAKAMLGFISEPVEGVREALVFQLDDGTCINFARAAYMMADAMLEERK